jgi:hypothetical protein
MKPNSKELWQRLVSEAEAAPLTPQPADDEIDRIVSNLRWQPAVTLEPTMDSILWVLISRFALPGAAALLLIAALLPLPINTNPADSVDALIAAAAQLP